MFSQSPEFPQLHFPSWLFLNLPKVERAPCWVVLLSFARIFWFSFKPLSNKHMAISLIFVCQGRRSLILFSRAPRAAAFPCGGLSTSYIYNTAATYMGGISEPWVIEFPSYNPRKNAAWFTTWGLRLEYTPQVAPRNRALKRQLPPSEVGPKKLAFGPSGFALQRAQSETNSW